MADWKGQEAVLHESMFDTALAAKDFMSIFLPVIFGYVASCLTLIVFT